MEDNKRKLYDALSQDYDLGSFEQFSADIADETKRRKLYDATAEEYDYGDYNTFSRQLGFGVESPSRPITETEPVGKVEQPAQSPVNPQAASEGRAMFNQQLASRRSTIADAPQATRQYMAENPVQGGRREMSREELVDRLATVGGVNQPIIDEYESRWADYQRDIDNELGGPEVDAKKKWLDEHNAEYRAAQQAIGEIEGQINLMDQPKNLEAIAAKKAENQKHIAPKVISTTGTGYIPSRGHHYDMKESAFYEAANNILDQTTQTYKQGSKYDPGYKGGWLEQTWTAARQFVEGGVNNFDMGSLTFGLTEGSSMLIARSAGDKSNKIVNDTLKKLGYTDKQINGLLDSVNQKGKNLSEMSDVIREESAALESMKETIDGWTGSRAELQAYTAEYNRRAREYNKSLQNYNTALADYEKDAKQYETIMSAVGAAVESGLSDGEKAVLDALQDFTTAKMRRAKDVSIASAAGAGAEQSAEFMLDFILTGGLEKASTKLVSKWLLKDATKELGFGGKVLADIISSAGRTAVMMPRNLATYGENLVQMTGGVDNLGRYQFDRTHLNAALNTALNQYIEYWSEGFGEYFAAGERAAFKRITGSAPRTTIGKTLSQYRGNIGQYLDHGKFNGMFNEMLEEVVGAHLDALAGWMSGDRVGDKDAIKNFYSGEQMATLALSFLPMSAISAGTNIRAYNKMKNRYDNAVATLNPFLNSDKITREELDELVSNIADKTPQEITAKIVEITDNARKKNGGYLPNNFTQSLMGYVEGSFAMSLNNETWENSQEKLGVVNAYTEQYSNPDNRNAYDLAQLESEARAAAMQAGFDENMLDLDSYSIARHAQALQQSDPRQAQVLLGYAVAKSANQGLRDGYDEETRQLFNEFERGIQENSVNGNVIRATAPDGNLVFITSQDASVGANGILSTPTGADGLVSYVDPNGRTLQAKASTFTGVTSTPTEYYILDQEQNFFDARRDAFDIAQQTISPTGKARALNANIGNTVFFRMNGIYEPMQVDRLTQDNTNVVVSGDPKFLSGLATMLGLQSPGGQSMELPIETIWPMLATNDDGSLATNQPEAGTTQASTETPSQPQPSANTIDGRPIANVQIDEENGEAYFTYQDDPNGMLQVMGLDEFRQKTGQAEAPAQEEMPAAPAEQPQAPAAEETPAEEAPQSKIPVDKDGNKIYDAPGVEPIDAYDDMYSTPGLTEEDVDEWVIAQSEEAEKNRNPKMKKGQSLQDWGKEKAEANRVADFWKQFRDIAEERAKEREEARKQEAERQKEIEKYGVDTRGFDLTPQTVEEAVANYLGNNEGIIDLDDAKKEVFGKSGRIPSELFRHVGNGGILTKKGGRTIADVANDIVGEYDGQLPIEQDTVRDLIIDYLARYTKTEMRDMIFNNRLNTALAELEQQNGASSDVETAEEVVDDLPPAEEEYGPVIRTYETKRGTVEVRTKVTEKDGVRTTKVVSIRNGAEVTTRDSIPIPDGYRIADEQLPDNTEVVGMRELREATDGSGRATATLVVKYDGVYSEASVKLERADTIPAAEEETISAEEAVEEAPEGTAVPEVEEPVAEPAEPEAPTAEEDVLLENETQEIRDAVDSVVSGKDAKKREVKSTLPDDFTIGGMDVNSYIRSRYDRFKAPLEKRREEIRKEYVAYRTRVENEARADILRNNPHIKEDNPYLPDYVSEEANKRLKNDQAFLALDAQIKAIDEQIGNYQTRRYNALAAIEEIYAKSQKPTETPENKPQGGRKSGGKSVTSQKEETPAEPKGPQMLTEQEIRNSGFTDEDVIDAAVDYINGNHGFAETLAYNQIEEYVRTQRSTTEQTGSNADQTQLDGPVVRTGGVAAEQSGSQPGEMGGNQETGTSERVPGSENGGVSAGVRGAANAQGAGLSSDAGNTGSERRGGSNRAGQSRRSSDDRGAGSESAPVAGQPGEQGTATQTGSAGLGDAGREGNVDQGRSGAGVRGGQNEQGAQGLADAQPARAEIEAGSTDIEALGGELEDLLKQFSNTTPSIDRDINGLDSVSHSVDTSGDEEGRLSRKQPKRPTAPLSLEGMTPQQMQLAGKILFSAAKLGYAFAKTEGLTAYNDFHRWFTGKFGDAVMKGLNYNETSLDAFIREVWNTKMKIDGERLTLEQHSQELHNAELREQSKKSPAERTRLQKEANEKKIPFKAANRKNIAEALPQLIPGQWDDVVAIERQFFDPSHNDYDHAYGKGMLITNGTGTGKTFTGLGVIKRFLDQGKGRILLVAPASMTGEWVDKAKIMGITATKLANTKDKGKGVVVTSYENFRENRALYEDDFDLVVYDECQNIIENQKGEDTLAFEAHKRITNKNVKEAMDRLVANTQPGRRKYELEQENDRLETERKKRSTRESRLNEIVIRQREIEDEIQDCDRQIALLKPSFQQKAEEAVKKTKVLMLSATPFNTVQNLKFAEGYIFQYPKVFKSDGTEVTDEGSRQSAFMTEWFRGDEPMEDMEIAFGDHLLDELETASYRELENGFDHSRDFPDVSGNVMASRFNAAWQAIQKDPRFQGLRDYTKFLTDPTWTTQLFETMKVSAIRERLKEHLDAGRKIVIFHDRVHETQSTERRPAVGPPFATVLEQALLASTQGKQTPVAAIAEFRQRFADVLAWEQTLDYRPVHEQIVDLYATDADRATFAREMEEYNRKMQQWQQDVQEFERRNPQMTPEELYEKMPKAPKHPQLKAESVAVYNGEKTNPEKDAAKAAFNDDNSKVKIICVTTRSGGAGLSLHDTTGKYPRVMIQTALPVSPIGFIQAEGRIFRWGNQSNAVFEYPRLGIDLEAYVFAMQFNAKAETVENLAHGFRGRGLKDSIMTGFWENSGNVPIDGQGIGGVEMDKRGNTLKGMAKAKHDYGVVQRKGVKEGDTSIPEPIGFKMAEWAKAQAGDNALIPFAGRGSIARYVPKGVSTSALEDNVSLQSDLMVTSGGADFKIREGNFTELNMINKADVVLLNGATDQGGLDQIDTFKKGFGHLSEGGRLIAIVPDNAAANNAIAEITGNLGGALRATIKVRNEALDRGEGTSRIVILDKISNPQLRSTAGQPVTVDLANSTKEQVFDLLENVNVPDRIIDKEAIAIKKLNALGTEFRKNRFVEDFKVTQYGRNQYITINYRRKPNGFNTVKRALDVIGRTGYYDRGSGRQYRLSDFDNPSQYHQYIKAYQVISEVLQMDDAEFRKFAMIENSAKAEDVDALRELYRLYQKMIRAAFGLTDSQIRHVLQGMRPDVSASDIETLNSYEELRAKFEAANHDDQERQDLYDKIAPIGEQLGLTIGAEAMDRDFLGGYNNVDNSLKVNKLRWNTLSDDKRATTLLHEFIHSVTVYALAAYNTNAPGVSDALFTAAKLASDVFDQVQHGAAQDVRPFTGFYAIENEKEIMAEMANPEFREKLKNRRMWVQRSPRGIRVSGAEMEGAELTNAWALLNEALDGMLKNFDKSLFDRFRGRVNDFFWEVDREGKPTRKADGGRADEDYKNNTNFVANENDGNRTGTPQDATGEGERNGADTDGQDARKVEISRDKGRIRVLETEVAPSQREYSDSSDRDYARRVDQDNEGKRLIDAAKANGLFIEPGAYSHLPRVAHQSRESIVYHDVENGRAIKIMDPFAAESMSNNNPSDELYRHIVHNIYFPESKYEFLGITTNARGDEVRFVLAQPWIESYERVTDAEADTFIKKHGFGPLDGYKRQNDDVVVFDFYGSNIRKDADGNIHLIDPMLSFKRDPREIINDYLGVESTEEEANADNLLFREETDPETLEKLEAGKKIKVYRAMQLIDGNLYPPMSAKVDGKMREPIAIGKWERAEERPELADSKGNFVLNKGNGSSLKAKYNPYIHTSRTPLNDQFTSAYNRPNLVTVEVEVPESELTSGYKAEKAKDAVGEMTWHSGPVSGKLPEGKKRKVILSRWDKPVRVLSDSEVADRIAELLAGENIAIPYNVVTPGLRAELAQRGVAISDSPSGTVRDNTLRSREGSTVERRVSAAEREATNATLDRMSEEMGIKINRVGRSEMPRGHKSDKGYYNPSTGEMTICMDNVTDERDAIATVLHETVGHHGLRKLFGDRFNDAMARIYAALDQKGKTWVNSYIARHPNADNTRAVEEYLSHLAESGNFKNTVWDNIRRIIGRIVDALFGTEGFLLTDNELNYILRASYENLKNPNWLDTVEGRAFDTLLKRQLGINETDPNKPTDPQGPDAGRLYRDGDTGIANDDYNREMDRKWNKALTENQDADRPVKIGMDKVMKEKGIKSISEDEDYVTRHNLASSRAESEAHEFELFRFTPLMDQVRAIQSRLLGKKATAADREQAYQRILDYMYAVSGLERNASKNAEIEQAKQDKLADAAAAGITDPAKLAEIEKKYEDMKRDWSGLTSLMGMSKDNWQAAETAARGMISAFESAIGDKAALDELWNRVRACTDFSLEHAYQHGLLTREEFERLHGTASQPRMWDFYLPLRGFNETTTEEQFGYETFTNPSRGNVVVKKMNGRWTQADNPLANIFNIAETEIVQGNDNWAKQALYRFTLNAGDNTLLSASEPWFVKNPATGKWSMAYPDPSETLEEFEERMKALRALDDPLAKKGRRGLKLENIMANKAHRNEHAIHLKVGGIDKMIWVNGNPALAKAVSGIGRAQNLQWLRRASRALSNLFTTYSLDFTAKNLIRDTVYSNIALHVKEDKAYRHQYYKNWVSNFGYGAFAFPMVRLAAEWESGKLQQKEKAGTLTKREQDFLNFMRDGGQTGYTIINSVNQIKKDLEKQMRSAGGRPGTVPILGWYAKAVKTLNEGFELLTRFTAYQTSRDMGRSGQRAASDAKEISVNFNRRGAQSGDGVWGNIAAYLGATHYFYNAGVQGFDNFLGLFKKKPVKMSAITAGFVIMGVLTPLINGMLAGLIGGGDGDDDWYWNLPEWVRRNNLVIGTGKWYVALPLPVEFRAPYGIGDIAGAAFAYEKYPNRTFGGVAVDIITTASGILPVNPIEGYTSNGNIGDAAIRAVAPDAGMFFVDWATDRDYTGRPLWKENPFSDTVPKSQGAYASTPKGIVAACQKLAEVSNGAIDIAPGVVRDFMNNYGGGFFRAAEDVSKLLFTDEERPRRWDNVPFFSGFTGHIDEDRSNSFAQNALYDYKKLSEGNVKDMNAILNTDDITSAVLYDEPESLYEREGVTVLQKAKIKRMLDSKDYALGKMYREGMNNSKDEIIGYEAKVSKNGSVRMVPKKKPGVNALRQEWKDLRDQWAKMPDKTEEQKSAKAEMDLQVQKAWHLYYDAMGDLAEKLMDYEYNK